MDDKGILFTRSALASEGAVMSSADIMTWFWSRQQAHRFAIEQIPFIDMKRWDLGFSMEVRKENIRRIAEVVALMNDTGVIVITSFISPYISDRADAREVIGDESFIEVFIDTPLEVCEQRDPKGLYKKARAGEIQQFTGISDPYEAPQDAEITLSTEELTPEVAVNMIIDDLKGRGLIG